jgi:chromosomal replication initiation ATPase DnaA
LELRSSLLSAENHASAERTVEWSSFSREMLSAVPEWVAACDRFLGYARYRMTNEGVCVLAPTHYHVRHIENLRPLIERALGAPLKSCDIGKVDYKALARERRENPPGDPRQLRIGIPPLRNVSEDAESDERKRRLSIIPDLLISPQIEAVIRMSQRWADSVNQGASAQVLWIYGRSGSGKSTLLKQLNKWVTLKKRLRAVGVMDFFSEWRQSIDRGDNLSFIRKFRKETDVFILENIDDLQGKTGTQAEVLHTITALMDRGASVVVSSTRPPHVFRELLEPALFSRLFSGMALEMACPDRVFKERLWRQLLEQNGLGDWPLDVRVLEKLFSIPLETPRDLHSFYINAIGLLSLKKTLQLSDVHDLEVRRAPREQANMPVHLSATDLIEKICRLCGVSLSALQGASRTAHVSMGRRFVAWALSRHLGLTNSTISQYLEKDASTISYALTQMERELRDDRAVLNQWNWICSELGLSSHHASV